MTPGECCDVDPFEDREVYPDKHLPACGRCEKEGRFALLRPHIVWFGEALDPIDMLRIETFIREGARHRLVFVAAGTSGVVYPAAGLVNATRARGAETWLVNADRADNASRFHHFVQGKSGAVLPALFDVAG